MNLDRPKSVSLTKGAEEDRSEKTGRVRRMSRQGVRQLTLARDSQLTLQLDVTVDEAHSVHPTDGSTQLAKNAPQKGFVKLRVELLIGDKVK